MVLKRFCIYLSMLLLFISMVKVEDIHARDFSKQSGMPYLQPLSDDSLQYAWNLYKLSLHCLEKGCPSLFFESSKEAKKIFKLEKYRGLSYGNLEVLLRNLEIYLSENRLLIDKDDGDNLGTEILFNLLGTGVTL